MNNTHLEILSEAIHGTKVKKIKVPLHVLLSEAIQVAKFTKTFWQSTATRPGLESAGASLPDSIGDDILATRAALQEAQTLYLEAKYLEAKSRPVAAQGQRTARARFVLAELKATLAWLLKGKEDAPAGRSLANIRRAHKADSASRSALAQALHDYASLAQRLQEDLNGLGGFDLAFIAEALRLADTVSGAQRDGRMTPPKVAAARLLRDQVASLLQEKMGLVRAAARFVFRGQAEIIRQVTSDYERALRGQRREKKSLPNK